MSATTQKELDLPDAATSKTYRILTTAVDACTTADDVAGAERWMTALQEANLQPSCETYASLINACTRTGNFQNAQKWKEEMESAGFKMDEEQHKLALEQYKQKSPHDSIISSSLNLSKERYETSSNDPTSFAQWSMGGTGPSQDSFDTQYMNHQFGLQPSIAPHTTHHEQFDSLQAQSSSHHIDRGQHAASKGKQESSPNTALIKSCAKVLSSARMIWSQNALQARSWRAVSKMIDMYTRAKSPEDILTWYDAMQSEGCTPTKATFDSAIEVYSHTGFVIGAVRWLTAMRLVGLTPDEATFRWAKRACARATTVREAEWCFEAMVQSGLPPDVGAFTAVINVCAHAGDVDGAENWFSAMHMAGIWPGAIAYNSVINAHAQAKDVAGAQRWFAAMEASGTIPNEVTYSSVIKACAQAADVMGAEKWFNAMCKVGFVPNAVPFNTVLNACARARNVQKAEQWLFKMRDAGLQPDQVSFNVMIKAHALCNDADGAERWFHEMQQSGVPHDRKSFSALATAYASARPVPFDRVERMVQAIDIHNQHEREQLMSHDTLASLLKSCAYGSPTRPDLAIFWFKRFVSGAHINEHIEKALALAIGEAEAQTEISIARNSVSHFHHRTYHNQHSQSQSRHSRQDIQQAIRGNNSVQISQEQKDDQQQADGNSRAAFSAKDSIQSAAEHLKEADCRNTHDLQDISSTPRGTQYSESHDDVPPTGFKQSSSEQYSTITGRDKQVIDPRQTSSSSSSSIDHLDYTHDPIASRSTTQNVRAHLDKGSSPSSDVIVEVHAPEDLHRYLIGTRGVTMRQIQHESGARIFFPTTRNTPPWAEPSGTDCITIVGSKAASERAKKLIAGRVTDYYTGIGVQNPEATFVRSEKQAITVLEAHSAMSLESRAGEHSSESVDMLMNPSTIAKSNTSTARDSSHSASIKANVPRGNIISACIKNLDAKGALSWFDAMRDAGLRASRSKCSVCMAINACTDATDAQGVIQWYQEMKEAGGAPNESTFNLAIKAFAQAGDISGAEHWIDAMWQVGFTPNAVSFNAVINRCARAGDVMSAERWLNLMQDAGATPSQLTFNSIIQAYTLAADPAGAVRWFDSMQSGGVSPNEKTFSSIINAYAQAKNISGAEQWFSAMQLAGFVPDAVSFNTVINACAQVRDVQRAEHWLSEMQAAGLKANQVTYNVMIKAHALSGDSAGAERWFEEMKRANFPHNLRSFSSMATAYGQASTIDLDKVKDMVKEMRALQLHPDHEVLTSLLKCCSHATPLEPELAIAWFKEFVPRAHLMAHVERALRQAVGDERAEEAIAWAKSTHPQAAPLQPWQGVPRNGNALSQESSSANTAGTSKRRQSTQSKVELQETVVEVNAPERCHRYLIGIRGAAIKQIQAKSGAQIHFPNTKNAIHRAQATSKDSIVIAGTTAACERARILLLTRLHNCRAYTTEAEDDDEYSAYSSTDISSDISSAQQHDSNFPALSGTTGTEHTEASAVIPSSNTAWTNDTRMLWSSQAAVEYPAVVGGDPSEQILTMCATALQQAGMAWSRNALVAAGFDNVESSKIIDMCTAYRAGNGIVQWYEAMQRLGCFPSEVTFTSAIKAYGYKKNTRAANAWLEGMRLVGIEPSQKAYCSIINAHVRAKDLSGAEFWFQRLRDAGQQPDQVAFNIMMNAYVGIRDLNAAEAWFFTMCETGFNKCLPLYKAILLAFCQARRVSISKVKSTVERMMVNEVRIDTNALAVLLKCCIRCSHRQTHFAAAWFQHFVPMVDLTTEIENDLLPQAVGKQMAVQLIQSARHMHPHLQHSGRQESESLPQTRASTNKPSSTHADAPTPHREQLRAGEEAVWSMDRMHSAVPEAGRHDVVQWHAHPEAHSMQTHQWHTIAGTHSWQAGQPQATARQQLSHGATALEKGNYLNALVVDRSRANSVTEAEQALHALHVSGSPMHSVSYSAMVAVYARAGQVKLMEHWLLATRAAGFSLEETDTLLPQIIIAYARGGNTTEAERWLNVMLASRIPPPRATSDAVLSLLLATPGCGDRVGRLQHALAEFWASQQPEQWNTAAQQTM